MICSKVVEVLEYVGRQRVRNQKNYGDHVQKFLEWRDILVDGRLDFEPWVHTSKPSPPHLPLARIICFGILVLWQLATVSSKKLHDQVVQNLFWKNSSRSIKKIFRFHECELLSHSVGILFKMDCNDETSISAVGIVTKSEMACAFLTIFINTQIFPFFRLGGSGPVIWSYFAEFQPKRKRGSMLSSMAAFWTLGNLFVASEWLYTVFQ